MENLCTRFPQLTRADVREALHDTNRHAGKAASRCKMMMV